mgnify:CR=1 FL=1
MAVLSYAYLSKAVAMLVNVNKVQKSALVSNEPTADTPNAMATSIQNSFRNNARHHIFIVSTKQNRDKKIFQLSKR